MSRPSSINQTRTILLATDDKNSVINELAKALPNPRAYTVYGWLSALQADSHIGFNGELCERIYGWYFLGNGYRVYNPVLMLFHSPDSWSPFGKGGLNGYAYCGRDPRNFTDPTGHMLKSLFGLKKAGKTLNNAQSTSSLSPLIPPNSPPKVPKFSQSPPSRLVSESIQDPKNTWSPQDPSTGQGIYEPLPAGRRTWTPPSESHLPDSRMTYAEMAQQQGFTGRGSTPSSSSTPTPGPPVNRSLKPSNPANRNVPRHLQDPKNAHLNPVTRPLPLTPEDVEFGMSINKSGEVLVDLDKYAAAVRAQK